MKITKDDIHDSKHEFIIKAYRSGLYDSFKAYIIIKSIGIELIINPKKNTRLYRESPEKRKLIENS